MSFWILHFRIFSFLYSPLKTITFPAGSMCSVCSWVWVVCVWIFTHAYAYVYVYVRVCVCSCMCECVSTSVVRVLVCVCIFVCFECCMYMFGLCVGACLLFVYVYMCVWESSVSVYMSVCSCVCICMFMLSVFVRIVCFGMYVGYVFVCYIAFFSTTPSFSPCRLSCHHLVSTVRRCLIVSRCDKFLRRWWITTVTFLCSLLNLTFWRLLFAYIACLPIPGSLLIQNMEEIRSVRIGEFIDNVTLIHFLKSFDLVTFSSCENQVLK